MASVPGSRSGGKILRPRRRTTAAGTPYDRPPPSTSQAHTQSPNWLSRFVISPTRFVASGAGKLFSAVLDLESSPTSSSPETSSPSSSSTHSSNEEIGTSDNESDKPFEGDDALNKGLQPLAGNSKSKHVIEKLLMQESFSREEGDRLINIIRSRVVDSPANHGDVDKRPRDMPKRTLGNDTDSPDICSAAVMEAKKWLQEKKSGKDSDSDLHYGSHGFNLVRSPQATKDEGSPVDVAKTYMRTRPPWASPSIDHIKSPTRAGIQLFKEETPHLFVGNSISSSKLKRNSSGTGSWSIQDEIRRVRSRATEEMLRTLPSSNIDWSAFAVEYKNNVNSSAAENVEASLEEKVHNFTKLVDASSNLRRGLGTPAFTELESKLDGFRAESMMSDPANIILEQNQVSGAVQQTKGSQDDCREITTSGQRDGSLGDMHRDGGQVKVNGIHDTNGENHQLGLVEETREALDSRLNDGNCVVFKEKVGAEDALANGFPSSGPSFSAGQVSAQNTKTMDKEPSTVDSSQERTGKDVPQQETCKLLSESMEVPDVIVNDIVGFKEEEDAGTGSQNSSSVYEIQQENTQTGSESELAATPTSIGKSKSKRLTRYSRRGRGVK